LLEPVVVVVLTVRPLRLALLLLLCTALLHLLVVLTRMLLLLTSCDTTGLC